MKKTKMMIFSVITFVLLITAACSSATDANDKAIPTGGNSSGDKYTINIAYGNQPGEPIDQLANKWKELAEEKSGDRLELKLYPSSQLGSEKDVLEQAIMGSNTVALGGFDYLMDYVPDIGILNGPYIADDIDELIYLTTTDWFEDIKKELRDKNIEVVAANTVYGERHIMTNKKVTTPEDLKGLKIRVPNNQMSIKIFEAMGAAATAMPLGDLYTSLQQGLIDGAENPLPVLQGVKTHEVSKHVTLTGHQKFLASWIAGTQFIETLPEDLYQILSETGMEASDFAREVLDEETASVIEEFEASGVEIHEVDTEIFKEEVLSVYEEFPSWTPGLYDDIQKILEERE